MAGAPKAAPRPTPAARSKEDEVAKRAGGSQQEEPRVQSAPHRHAGPDAGASGPSAECPGAMMMSRAMEATRKEAARWRHRERRQRAASLRDASIARLI